MGSSYGSAGGGKWRPVGKLPPQTGRGGPFWRVLGGLGSLWVVFKRLLSYAAMIWAPTWEPKRDQKETQQ